MGHTALRDAVRAGREALAAADWTRARAAFEAAAARAPTAEAIDGLGDAAHFEGRHEEAIELKERAFALYRESGQAVRAADTARGVAFLHATCHGGFAVASGWMARAAALLEDVPECAAHGWLTLDRAPFTRDLAEREALAAAALAIAKRFGDGDLEVAARALLGEAYVACGRVAEGMQVLDSAMAAVSAGEVADHIARGEICCRLLSACEHALDVRRAEDWLTRVDRAVAWKPFVRPTCRTHYGGILVARGRWDEAEAALLDAIRAFERGYRADRVFPLVRLAELRVRQGRYEEAERLLEGVDWHPAARRAAATIALARGELRLAEERARLCFEGADAADPACAPLLELLVRIAVARDDLPAARHALDRLAALADESPDERAAAFALLGTGRVLAAEGDERAAGHLERAFERFARLELPLEAARAQLELGRALAATAPDAAVAEARQALAKLERLGAAHDADAAAGLLRDLGVTGRPSPRGPGSLTRREAEVLALLADGLSNAEIAGRLYISRRTAEHHVASILAKLGLRSRAEAAAHAAREPSQDP